MPSERADPCNSTYFDGRKDVERRGGIELPITRSDKKYMKLHGISDMETFISYPYLDGNDIVFDVCYADAAEQEYIISLDELTERYKKKMSKLLLSKKYEKTQALKQKIEAMMVLVHHEYQKGAVLYLLFPTDDTKRDRVVFITDYVNEGAWCFNFMQDVIPKYTVKHIECKYTELDGNGYKILQTLSNGKRIYRGGQGIASGTDVSQMVGPSDNVDQYKYNYLLIQIFLRDQKIKKYKEHCQQIGIEQVKIIGNILKNWLRPKNKDIPKDDTININPEIKNKEFQMLIRSKCGQYQWEGTKAKKILEIDYEDSLEIFGGNSIVKTFKEKNMTPFILSITELVLTHYINRNRMKIECFISHVWDD